MMTDVVKFTKFWFHFDNDRGWMLAWAFEIDGQTRFCAFPIDYPNQRESSEGHDIISKDLREYIRDRVTAQEFLRTREEGYAA